MSSTQMTGSAGKAEIVRPRAEVESSDATPHPPRPVPTMGLRAVFYRAMRSLGLKIHPPKLSKKELASIALEQRRQRFHDSITQLRELTDQVGRATIAFFGMSGSAATTTSVVNAAAVFAEKTRTLVACSDFNPANGTAAARLGKDYTKTLSVKQFARMLKAQTIQHPSDLLSVMRPTENGVRVLGANDRTVESGEVPATTVGEMLTLIAQVYEFHFIDTANDTGTPSMRKILEQCDIPVFTANVDERKSLQSLGITMENARKVPGMLYKTNNSVVVISRLPQGEVAHDYDKFLNRVNIHEQVTSPYEFHGQMMPVHEAETLAHNAAVDLNELDWSTLQEYVDLNIAILEQIILARTHTGKEVTP